MTLARHCRRTRCRNITVPGIRRFRCPSEQEAESLKPCFGVSVWNSNNFSRQFTTNKDKGIESSTDQHALFEQQMEEMKAEREALFGFTEEDQNAWSNSAGHHHEASFMQLVSQARQEQQRQHHQEEEMPTQSKKANETNDYRFGDHALHLSHLTSDGKDINMVDVGHKETTKRVAVAESKVVFPPEVFDVFVSTGQDMVGPKGPIFATAKIAGIMAAK